MLPDSGGLSFNTLATDENAWTDMRTAALHVPKFRGIEVEKVARRMPDW